MMQFCDILVSQLGKLSRDTLEIASLVVLRLLLGGKDLLLSLVVGLALDLSLLLKLLDNIFVLPANFLGQSSDGAIFSAWAETENAERIWYNYSLGAVVWWWDTFKDL